MNRTILVGRLTKDVDLRYTENGVAVANFTIAVNRPFKNQQTNEHDADFINCVVWRKPAENLANYMKKGSQIGVDGRIQTRSYENQDGKSIFVTEVVADSVQFLESKSNTNSQGSNQNSQKPPKNESQGNPFEQNGQPLDISDDSLPF